MKGILELDCLMRNRALERVMRHVTVSQEKVKEGRRNDTSPSSARP